MTTATFWGNVFRHLRPRTGTICPHHRMTPRIFRVGDAKVRFRKSFYNKVGPGPPVWNQWGPFCLHRQRRQKHTTTGGRHLRKTSRVQHNNGFNARRLRVTLRERQNFPSPLITRRKGQRITMGTPPPARKGVRMNKAKDGGRETGNRR